ncbi:PadR family transcriptional regulator [Christensenellaceae bacterium OttesenSCG-928-K19]|nr:PadR family transcriptional regulator [Christensenellaceae bacterium OttesenSCG-928-K19]
MIEKSLMAGSTILLVLKLLEQGDLYGYQMIESLQEQSNNVFELKAGTLYPLLHTLEQDGAVETYEQQAQGRTRKYYHLTAQGQKLLKQKTAEWQKYAHAMKDMLGGMSYAGI